MGGSGACSVLSNLTRVVCVITACLRKLLHQQELTMILECCTSDIVAALEEEAHV